MKCDFVCHMHVHIINKSLNKYGHKQDNVAFTSVVTTTFTLPQALLGLWEVLMCLRLKGSLSLELRGWCRSSYKYLEEDQC